VESAASKKRRFWSAWCNFLALNFPQLDAKMRCRTPPQRVKLLAAFAQHVRTGGVSRTTKQVCTQTVEVALHAISTTFQMDHEPSPLVTTQGKYMNKISQLLESYRREDPPSKPKLAVPLLVPNYLVLAGLNSNDPKQQAVGNLATIAFHYLLRSGEYTFVNPKQRCQTKQFRVCDVIFWKGNTILPHSLPLETLLRDATEGTLNISNQKNGKRAQTIHQEVTGTPPCPVHALIRQVKQILQYINDTSTIISTFSSQWYSQSRELRVGCITRALQTAVQHLRLDRQGIRPSNVSSHSLRAGEATAIDLNNIPDSTIQKMGRWSSNTFLICIHEQIAAFSRGVPKQMGLKVTFKSIRRSFEPINSPELHTAPCLAQN
jgi:hypothetical protein